MKAFLFTDKDISHRYYWTKYGLIEITNKKMPRFMDNGNPKEVLIPKAFQGLTIQKIIEKSKHLGKLQCVYDVYKFKSYYFSPAFPTLISSIDEIFVIESIKNLRSALKKDELEAFNKFFDNIKKEKRNVKRIN
jgi:hypothetical protein